MTNPIPQSHTTITSVGSVVASILSAGTAFLAWKTKLRFSKEFTEAKKAQVEAARAQTEIAEAKVKAAEAQKNAEIEKIKAEIA
ncbi:MAG: hypothetical protein QNJ49_22070, partial [Mastigocoleus sp. MO_167.B18]|nr:hypothetical protein [Mastigocoleus sp. MO_167.B18]